MSPNSMTANNSGMRIVIINVVSRVASPSSLRTELADRAHLSHQRLQPGDETVVPRLDPDDQRPEDHRGANDVFDGREAAIRRGERSDPLGPDPSGLSHRAPPG